MGQRRRVTPIRWSAIIDWAPVRWRTSSAQNGQIIPTGWGMSDYIIPTGWGMSDYIIPTGWGMSDYIISTGWGMSGYIQMDGVCLAISNWMGYVWLYPI